MDKNEFTHKSTRCDSYPAIRFYPRTANGEKKTKWVNYREGVINGKVGKDGIGSGVESGEVLEKVCHR